MRRKDTKMQLYSYKLHPRFFISAQIWFERLITSFGGKKNDLEIEVNEIKLEIQINDWVWDRFSHDRFAEIARFPGSEPVWKLREES
jgi:hypothetical protein